MSLPPVPGNYICNSCSQIGAHWIMNCNDGEMATEFPFCKYPHDYYSIVAIFGEFPMTRSIFSNLLASNYQNISDIEGLIPFIKNQRYTWFQLLDDNRIIRVGTLMNYKNDTIEILSLFDTEFEAEPNTQSFYPNQIKWIGIIDMMEKYKIIRNNLAKLNFHTEDYNDYNRIRLKHAHNKSMVYSRHADDYFMVESSNLTVYNPAYGMDHNGTICTVENGKWYIRYDNQLLIEHESASEQNAFLHDDALYNEIIPYDMFDNAQDELMNNDMNKALVPFWSKGIAKFEEFCKERINLLKSILPFPESVCDIIVNVFEINPRSNYWHIVDKKWYQDTIPDNWEFPYIPYHAEIGFESYTFGIFDNKYIGNEDCVEQKIKDECELLWIEYGYNEVYEELWSMMYSETLNYVAKDYESPEKHYCSLPFGVAAYKGPYESESLLVKRNPETDKIIAAVVAHLWGD